MKVNQCSIEGWEEWYPEFRTFNDPQLVRMKQEAFRFGREHYRYKYASEYEPDLYRKYHPRWLTLLGSSGAGKTMLAKKLAGFVYPWPTLAKILRAQEYGRFDDICDEKICCIDDIGSEYQSDFVNAKLYEMFSRREGKWTIFTANLSVEQVSAKVDPRIASRMLRHGSVVVEVDITDFNLRSALREPTPQPVGATTPQASVIP